METTIVYWGSIGLMEKKMETSQGVVAVVFVLKAGVLLFRKP